MTVEPTAAATRPPLAPRHWPVWLGIGLLWLAVRLPWPLQRGIGVGIGELLHAILRGRRRVADANLALCFPGLEPAARERLRRQHFHELGFGLFEFGRAWWGSIGRLRANTAIDGLQHLHDARLGGRGVILVSGHFTTLEVCGRLLCDHAPIAGMYRRHAAPAFEWAVLRGRLRYATAMFRREELRASVRHLKQGGILWYAPDQDMRGKDSVFAPFFGRPASTITATHQLARLTGAAVVPFFHRREGRHYRLRLGAALPPPEAGDAVAHTARVNAAIEAMVREVPAQYLWIHKRFKTQPPGAPDPYVCKAPDTVSGERSR